MTRLLGAISACGLLYVLPTLICLTNRAEPRRLDELGISW